MSDLTTRATANELACTPETVRALIRDGLLRAHRLRGDHGPFRVPAAALDEYRERQASLQEDPWVRTRDRRAS